MKVNNNAARKQRVNKSSRLKIVALFLIFSLLALIFTLEGVKMIELNETIHVARNVDDVFRYASDFTYISEWDPFVSKSQQTGEGDMGIGTSFDLTLNYFFKSVNMTYTITAYEPPFRVALKGEGASFSVVDTLRFFPEHPGTRIEYTAKISFLKKSLKPSPLIKWMMNTMGKVSVRGLEKWLQEGASPVGKKPLSGKKTNPIDWALDRSIIPGMLGFSKLGYYAGKMFRDEKLPRLTGKKVIITGATSGIGKATAIGLATLDADLTFIARDKEKALATQQEIIGITGNPHVKFLLADLSVMACISSVSQTLLETEKNIDILINNAGALFNDRKETVEGIEKTFATDLLGVYHLTERLIPLLSKSEHPRIINVSSGGMYTQKIDIQDLENTALPYNGAKAYARAKRGIVILTEMWAHMLENKGFHVHAMHPGWVETPGVMSSLPGFYRLTKKILRTPAQGADSILWLASAQLPGQLNGKFWLDRRPHVTHVFPGTKASAAEKKQLIRSLDAYVERLS